MRKNNNLPKIIVACSDTPLRLVLVHTLRTSGCGVEGVGSHRALMERCARCHYALILTCFHAPLIEDVGVVLRLCGRVANGTPYSQTSLFVLAPNLSPSEVVALLERGVEQVLSLPVSAMRLRQKVYNSLSRCMGL